MSSQTLEPTLDPTLPTTSAAAPSTDRPGGDVALDIQATLEMLPHRFPFLMIDRVLEVDPGKRAVGVKCVTVNEPHFQGHFPGQPIMPGVLITEAFAQLACVVALTEHPEARGKAVLLLGLDKLRFRHPVRPGDRMILTVEKIFERRALWKLSGIAEVDGVRVADGIVMATITDADRPR